MFFLMVLSVCNLIAINYALYGRENYPVITLRTILQCYATFLRVRYQIALHLIIGVLASCHRSGSCYIARLDYVLQIRYYYIDCHYLHICIA